MQPPMDERSMVLGRIQMLEQGNAMLNHAVQQVTSTPLQPAEVVQYRHDTRRVVAWLVASFVLGVMGGLATCGIVR